MDKVSKKSLAAGAVAVGAALAGAAYYVFQEKQTEEPDYRALVTDGDFQIRDYPAITVAETTAKGERRQALSDGFRVLADYIFAKSRAGEKLAMTVPVMQDGGAPMASDPPAFDDDVIDGGWRVRFVMPGGRTSADLPPAPEGVTLIDLPARKIAVVQFAGRPEDTDLAAEEDRLRGWLARRGETGAAEPEYAFYNSPPIPGPLRRNEIWLALS